jgi:hypothetical protein
MCQIWYKLKASLEILFEKIGHGCSRLGVFMGNVDCLRPVGNAVGRFVGRVRTFFSRDSAVDDDGSTMLQGLLMRENL